MQEEKKQVELDTPVVFEHAGQKYIYDPTQITMHRARIAEEVMNFKAQQVQKGYSQFSQLQLSGGMEYFQEAVAPLLIKENGTLDYSGEVSANTINFVKSLPALHYSDLLEKCVDHFFLTIGKRYLTLYVFKNSLRVLENLTDLETRKPNGKESVRDSLIRLLLKESSLQTENSNAG